MKRSKYIAEARWIQNLVIDHLADQNHQLPIRIDCKSGKVLDPNLMIDDLGDFVQYTYYTGKLMEEERYMNFALKSARHIAESYQHKTGVFKNLFGYNYHLDWYSNEDTFYGMSSLYALSGDDFIGQVIDNYTRGIWRFMHSSGLLYGATAGFEKHVGRTPITIVEGLAHAYSVNNTEANIELATKLVNPWIDSEFFNRYGLFPDHLFKNEFTNKVNHSTNGKILGKYYWWNGNCTILKNNSNLLQGILELWKVTNEDIYLTAMSRWIRSIEEKTRNDYIYGNYNVFTRRLSYFNKPMFTTIHILGFYSDYVAFIGNDRVKKILCQIMDNVLKDQTDLGFFRIEPYNHSDEKFRMGWLDQQTDISVVLLKAYTVTNDKMYLDAARNCVDAVINYLKRPFGYLEYFSVDTGENCYHSRLYTKFLTLFPKVLILLDAAINKRNIFTDDLYIISGDR